MLRKTLSFWLGLRMKILTNTVTDYLWTRYFCLYWTDRQFALQLIKISGVECTGFLVSSDNFDSHDFLDDRLHKVMKKSWLCHVLQDCTEYDDQHWTSLSSEKCKSFFSKINEAASFKVASDSS